MEIKMTAGESMTHIKHKHTHTHTHTLAVVLLPYLSVMAKLKYITLFEYSMSPLVNVNCQNKQTKNLCAEGMEKS